MDDYVKQMEGAIKYLKHCLEQPPKDRLESMSRLIAILGILSYSTHSWSQWVTNSLVLEAFTKEELEMMERDLISFILPFLDLDLKWTRKKAEDIKKANKRRIRLEV